VENRDLGIDIIGGKFLFRTHGLLWSFRLCFTDDFLKSRSIRVLLFRQASENTKHMKESLHHAIMGSARYQFGNLSDNEFMQASLVSLVCCLQIKWIVEPQKTVSFPHSIEVR